MVPLPERVRIFPLGEVVFFPDTLLPLQIFEPRYRAMLADALDGDSTIGMVLIRDPEPNDEQIHEGAPPVYSIGCAGKIVQHKELSDGRSLIVLQGTVKFRISEELPVDTPYRVVRPQALYEAPPAEAELRAWRKELELRVEDLVTASGGERGQASEVFEKLELGNLVNYIAASMPLDVVEKQALLECATVEERFRKLSSLLEFKAVEARAGMESRGGPLH